LRETNQRLLTDASVFPKKRPSQQAYADQVARAIIESEALDDGVLGVTLIEADTGVGKSLGYLLPLMLHSARSGKRVAVATHTRGLRLALLDDARALVPIIKKETGVDVKVSTRFAMGDFVDIEYLEGWVATQEQPLSAHVKELCAWVLQCIKTPTTELSGRYEDFLELSGIDCIDGLHLEDVSVDSRSSPKAKSAFDRHCMDAEDCDLLLITQAMYVIHAKCWFTVLDNERPISTIIIDEADQMPSVAMNVFSRQIALHKQSNLFASALQQSLQVEEANSAFHQMLDIFDSFEGISQADITENPALLGGVRYLNDTLSRLFVNYSNSELSVDFKNLYLLHEQLDTYLSVCYEKLEGKRVDANALIEYSNVYRFPSLKLQPTDVGHLLSRLYIGHENSGLKSIIYTSATLSYVNARKQRDYLVFENSVGIFVNAQGVNKQGQMKLLRHLTANFEPVDYGQLNIYQAPKIIPPPFKSSASWRSYSINQGWAKYVASIVEHTKTLPQLDDCGRRTLVLVRSFHVVEALTDFIEDCDDVYFQTRTNRKEVIQKYHDNPNGILVSASLWSGFNSRTANVVIAQLPFSKRINDSDPMKSAMTHKKHHKELFCETKQGIGRGLRHEKDKARIFIADVRFPYFKAEYRPEKVNAAKSLNLALPERFQNAWRQAQILLLSDSDS
jgi:ATP-dependent DNA helicase DinG